MYQLTETIVDEYIVEMTVFIFLIINWGSGVWVAINFLICLICLFLFNLIHIQNRFLSEKY